MSIDIGSCKGARNNYYNSRHGLRVRLKANEITEKLTIKCLRPRPGDRIDVVFADNNEAGKAKQHTCWLASSFHGARIKRDQWYPVKVDNVVEQCVLDQDANDGKTLKKGLSQNFKTDDGCCAVDCTVMKATWLSKVDAKKKVESMVVWLKSKPDADYLLRTGMALFGATDAFCSPFVIRDNSGPCYHCDRYGHEQPSCNSQIKCAICSKGHRRDECANKDRPKCPACVEAHTVFGWASKLHPQHYRHVGQQKARVRQGQRKPAEDVDMDDTSQASQTSELSASGGGRVASAAISPSSTSC